MTPPPELIYASSAVFCAGLAAMHDLKKGTIPNRLSGSAIVAGVLLHLTLGGFAQAGWALLAGLLAGGIFFLFYLAGGMGAGDVKLMAGIGCLVGMSSVREVLLSTVIIGGVLAIGLAVIRGKLGETLRNVWVLLAHHQAHGLQKHPELNLGNRLTLRLPYALPMALGCATTLYLHVHGGPSR